MFGGECSEVPGTRANLRVKAILCSDASQPAAGGTTQRWDSQQTHVTMWHCLGSHPASIWYQIHRSSLDLGGLHRAEGKPQVWLPAPPIVEEPIQGFQLQSRESIFKREMMQMFPSSLAYVHARKGQFYLGAVRVTSL